MADRVFDPGESAVVKKGRGERNIPERGRTELVAVGGETGDLLQAEVFILAGPVEDHIAPSDSEKWGDLRHSDYVHLEIAEHLVRLPRHRVTAHAFACAEKHQSSLLFRFAHGIGVASRELVYRGVRKR